MQERRKHCRYTLVIGARVVDAAGERPGQLHDISREGAMFVADVPTAPGAAAHLQFYVDQVLAEAVGDVVRISQFGGSPCVALHFHTGNDAYIALIAKLDSLAEVERPLELERVSDVVLRLG